MKVELTAKLIDKLQPKDKYYDIWDTKQPGFILRVRPSGVMTYMLIYKRGHGLTIGRTDKLDLAQARVIAKEKEAQATLGNDPIKQKQKQKAEMHKAKADNYLTFLDEIYKGELESENPKTAKESLRSLRASFPELHKLALNEITLPVMKRWRERRRREGLKPSSIDRQLDDLKRCLNYAVEEKFVSENPLVGFGEDFDNKRKRVLHTDEEKALRKELEGRTDLLREAVLLSLNTGLRKGELFKLRWPHVNLKVNRLELPGEITKSGESREVPLTNEALDILKKMQPKERSLGFVFCKENGNPFKDMDTSWEAVLERLKIENFIWHDMRRTFATKLLNAGTDPFTVCIIGGWTDFKTMARYAQSLMAMKKCAINKIASVKIG